MGRDELKDAVEEGGFVRYDEKQLPKVDSMRRDKSQPSFYGVPILHDSDVLFTTASELGGHPASCYTCKEQQSNGTCARLGPDIKVTRVKGARDSGDQIEYWPCCSMHEYGKAEGAPHYHDALDTPDSIGLIWINAPKVGQPYGGANCGGIDGGDDCDHYITQGKTEKWDAKQGLCRVLQHEVEGGDVCSAWRDDDILGWQDAQQLMDGDSIDTVAKKKAVREIIRRDV